MSEPLASNPPVEAQVAPEGNPAVDPEVVPQEIPEATPALSGLRRLITTGLLATVREKLETSDRVLRATPEESRFIRGFKSKSEDPDLMPATPIQKITAIHRQGQVRKVRKAGTEKWRITNVHGEKPTDNPALQPRATEPGNTDAVRWEASRQKIVNADTVKVFDARKGAAEPDERTQRHQRKAISGSAARYRRKDRVIDRTNRRLDRAAEGDTLPGIIRGTLLGKSSPAEQIPEDRQSVTPTPVPTREVEPIQPVIANRSTDPTTPRPSAASIPVIVHKRGKLFGGADKKKFGPQPSDQRFQQRGSRQQQSARETQAPVAPSPRTPKPEQAPEESAPVRPKADDKAKAPGLVVASGSKPSVLGSPSQAEAVDYTASVTSTERALKLLIEDYRAIMDQHSTTSRVYKETREALNNYKAELAEIQAIPPEFRELLDIEAVTALEKNVSVALTNEARTEKDARKKKLEELQASSELTEELEKKLELKPNGDLTDEAWKPLRNRTISRMTNAYIAAGFKGDRLPPDILAKLREKISEAHARRLELEKRTS